jgi:hypothetical protein
LDKRRANAHNVAGTEFFLGDRIECEIFPNMAWLEIHAIPFIPKVVVIAEVDTDCRVRTTVVGLRDFVAGHPMHGHCDGLGDTIPVN